MTTSGIPAVDASTGRSHITGVRADAGPIVVRRSGVVPYGEACDLQRELVAARAAGEIPDTVLLLEHPPVYTLGTRADTSNIVYDEGALAARGIEVVQADRGGDVTYHGPGQLVGYPIMQLSGPRVVDFVRALEEVNLAVLAGLGVTGRRIADYTGVWVDTPDGVTKVTAIGVRVSSGYVTQHGWATNVSTDMDHFAGIVACGITDEDKSVGTLTGLGIATSIDDVAERTVVALGEVFDADVTVR